LLAALLRIADELDLTFERAPLINYEHLPPRDPISKEEWEKQLSISGVAVVEDRSIIKSSAKCKNPNIHRSLKILETKINNELDDLPNHLYQYRDFRKDLPRKFFIDIEAEDYTPHDFKFSLQERQIVNLLMGDKLYKRKEESLRELLKNSVDGCRLRRELLKKHVLSYNPEIVFELSPEKDRIIVTDNGIGMDEDVIERYFTKIGESFYNSPEFLEQGLNFAPVSELGIGILSCFMVANKVVVETKTDDSDPLLIEIDDVSDYFFVREGSRKDTGTSVTLFLKGDIGEKIDLEKEIRYYARHLEIPIKVLLSSGKERIIEDVGFKPDLEVFVSKQQIEKYDFHSIEIDDDYVEGVIALLLEKDNKIGLKPKRDWWAEDLKRTKLKDQFFMSNEGIFIGNINILPEYLTSEIVFIDLNLKRNGLDFNAARNDIVQNDKFDKFMSNMESMLINGFGDFLGVLEQKCRKVNVDHKELFNDFFMEYLDRWRIERIILKEKNGVSDKLLDFIKHFYHFKYISKDGISYINCDEIMRSGKPIHTLRCFDRGEEYIKQIFSTYPISMKGELLYLLSEEYYYDIFADCLFDNIYTTKFSSFLVSFLGMAESDELKDMMPTTWKLTKFQNYKTPRLIEFSYHSSLSHLTTILNRDHKLVNLLVKGKHIIEDDKKMAVLGFFRNLKKDLKSDFQKVVDKQKDILKWFIDAQLISEDEMGDYILTKDDFPTHLFFERDGDWWIGYVEELPGANTQGRTLPEARENLKEAVEMVVEANRELTPQSCSPLFCHQVYHHPPSSICAHPTTRPPSPRMPANSFWGGTAGA
jgi:predicted RNase H-like HicB family nuclease